MSLLSIKISVAILGIVIVMSNGLTANEEYAGQFNYGQAKDKGLEWTESIRVISPDYRSFVEGDTAVSFVAPDMEFAEARCWHQPDNVHTGEWGYDAVIMKPRKINGGETNTFMFHARNFPHGPVNVRISAYNSQGNKDVCELQLYNKGGVEWNAGVPETAPEPAKGMKLVFEDDFTGPLSISKDGRGARYNAHKPRFGDFSGWRFSHKDDFDGAHDPFEQIDTYLRIKARKLGNDKKKGCGTGLIASVNMDGEGFWVKAPFYMECRFTAQSAPGTWPAFWTITSMDRGIPGDELDIVECYGGVGKGNPNHPGYSCVSHFWRQTDKYGNKKKGVSAKVPIMELAGKSYWSATFHTYGVKVTEEYTVYYFDGMEVMKHPTNDISYEKPHLFLINYAIGGISGWKIDLERYNNGSDMWVDYVRVYSSN